MLQLSYVVLFSYRRTRPGPVSLSLARVDIPVSLSQGLPTGLKLRAARGEKTRRARSRHRRSKSDGLSHGPAPSGPALCIISAAPPRRRARGPVLAVAHLGEALAGACKSAARSEGGSETPVEGGAGRVQPWGHRVGRQAGRPRAQAGRGAGGRGCPARVSRRCVALKWQRERRRRRARPRLRGGAGGGGGGAGSSSGPRERGPERRLREAPAQRPGPFPPRPAPGARLPGRG